MNNWKEVCGGVMLVSIDIRNVKVDKEKETSKKYTAYFNTQSKCESW